MSLHTKTARDRANFAADRLIFAIDPGKHTGVAAVYNGRLYACTLVDGDHPERIRPWVKHYADAARWQFGPRLSERVVWELPQIYPGKQAGAGKHARPQDLITLAITGARVCQAAIDQLDTRGGTTELEDVEPAQWKGQVPKDIMVRRIESFIQSGGRLDGRFDETTAFAAGCVGVAPSKINNILDAIGLGLWVAGRFATGVVPAL